MTCLTAATHNLYQCWLIVDGILWHSIEDTSTCIAKDTKRKCLEIWLDINGIFQYIRTRSSVCFITYTFLKTTSLQISNSCAKKSNNMKPGQLYHCQSLFSTPWFWYQTLSPWPASFYCLRRCGWYKRFGGDIYSRLLFGECADMFLVSVWYWRKIWTFTYCVHLPHMPQMTCYHNMITERIKQHVLRMIKSNEPIFTPLKPHIWTV